MKEITIVEATEVKVIKTKITSMREAVRTVDITDPVAVKVMAGNIKKMLDFLVGKRDALIEPAKAIIAEAKNTYDPYIEICKVDKAMLTKMATDHIVEQQRLAKIEEDRIAAEAQKKKDKIQADLDAGKISEEKAGEKLQVIDEKATDKMGEVDEVSKTHGGINVRMIKKVVIFRPEAVPDQYWIIDEVLVRKQALAGVEIPGVKIDEVPSGALTGK